MQICPAAGLPPPRPQGLLQAFSFAFHLITCMVLQRNNEQDIYLSAYLFQGIGSPDYGVPQSALCRLGTQERQWCKFQSTYTMSQLQNSPQRERTLSI